MRIKGHEVLDGGLVGAPGAWITEIGEPLDLERHVDELVKLDCGQNPRSTGGGILVGSR
jgi:hypothetical protein